MGVGVGSRVAPAPYSDPFFRSVVVGAVVDAFSRRVLAIRVSSGEPDAAFACRLIAKAIARHGKPKHLVTDRGVQFASKRFTRLLTRRKIQRRFGAVGSPNSIAKIERFCRTLKSEFARGLVLWAPLRSLERKLSRYVSWFNRFRPHESLGRRTPDEVHRGVRPRPTRRVERGVLEVKLLDGDRRLPIFQLRPAA